MISACWWCGYISNPVRKCLPLADGAVIQISQCVNMLPLTKRLGVFFSKGIAMNADKTYHIKDEFFEIANDSYLMSNKEDGGYRPNFFCFRDGYIGEIFWAIPMSSKIEKYERIIQKKIERYGECKTIVIDRFADIDTAFLIQNMFPVIEKYVDHEHTIGGISVNMHEALVERLINNAQWALNIQRRGGRVIFPDVNRLYDLMKRELELAE